MSVTTERRRRTPDVIESVRRRVAQGERQAHVAAELGIPKTTLHNWIRYPDGQPAPVREKPFRTFDENDTYIDEVAVRRALGGDREVYRNLTPTERLEFCRRAERLFDSEREAEWRPQAGRHSLTETKWNLLTLLGISGSTWRQLKAAARGEA